MAISRSLRRLHRLREVEEHQKWTALVSAIRELHRLQGAQQAAHDRAKLGRTIVNAALQAGESEGRIAGLEEIAAADRAARVLTPRIQTAEDHIAQIREELLQKRVQRRQAETLLELASARDSVEGKRRSQIALDDWHRSRLNTIGSNHREGKRLSVEPTDAPASERT